MKFTKENIREHEKHMLEYRKKATTKMMWVWDEFECETLEGVVKCKDGYVAIDSKGYPYPIDVEVHEETYERVK